MKNKLQKAAKELSKQMKVTVSDFDNSTEVLDEGFALIRASRALHDSICKTCDLKPNSVELVLMCLKPKFANGRRYSLPHKHYKKSLTAVVPMSYGGTFLPTEQRDLLRLQEDKCFIEGNKPHAFGMKGDDAFIAALTVTNLESDTAPIRQEDGSYRLKMLQVKQYAGDTLHVAT
jgi:hypothetical protein